MKQIHSKAKRQQTDEKEKRKKKKQKNLRKAILQMRQSGLRTAAVFYFLF